MQSPQFPSAAPAGQPRLLGYWLLLMFAVCVYISGLGGLFIPRNGDEMVYAHIARLTAASNHWLPLVSELTDMRNTKPPLLFWQAMVAGDWGTHWTLWALRLPSLVYTLLVTAGIVYLTQRLTNRMRLGLLAGSVYLAFFCTFRYGRPYLTSAAESFWFNLPIFILLLRGMGQGGAGQRTGAKVFSWPLALFFGLLLGIGLLYKSFALIAPAGACLACTAWLLYRPSHAAQYLVLTAKLALSCALALGVFALWFALDPDPQAVWREFVVGENAGKMNHHKGYWATALRGGSSMWLQLLGYAQNAGLLAIMVVAAMAYGTRAAWRGLWRRGSAQAAGTLPKDAQSLRNNMTYSLGVRLGQSLTIASKPALVMLACLAIWLVVFTLPSQRSARYIIPAMPFLAIVLALLWQRLHRAWFVLSLIPVALALVLLGTIGFAAYQLDIATLGQTLLTLGFAAVGAFAIVASLRGQAARTALLWACIAVLAAFNSAVAPLDASANALSAAHSPQWRNQRIAVPEGFNGQFERYQFILPGNLYSTYAASDALSSVLARVDAVMWVSEQAPACIAQATCTLVGSRWDVRTRHASGEITLGNVLTPQAWLFRREWMVAR